MTPDHLREALKKHGLPTYGTDEELQVRYDRNFNAPKPVAAAKTTFRKAKPAAALEEPELKNELLGNRASSQAVEVLPESEVVSDTNESKDV